MAQFKPFLLEVRQKGSRERISVDGLDWLLLTCAVLLTVAMMIRDTILTGRIDDLASHIEALEKTCNGQSNEGGHRGLGH